MQPMQPQPFTLVTQTVVQGGYLGKDKWSPELIDIDGESSFMPLAKEDRKLARALGFDMTEERPMKDVSVMAFIAKKRDEAIDKLIVQYEMDNDPMARKANRTRVIKGREKGFKDAAVPGIIDVSIDEVVSASGAPSMRQITMRVQTIPRRGGNPVIQMTSDVLQWLLEAAMLKFDVSHQNSGKSHYYDSIDLPILPPPLKYRKMGRYVVHLRNIHGWMW